MPEFTPEEETGWRVLFGDEPIHGSAEPQENKCGAVLRNKHMRLLEDLLGIERGSLTKRYCRRPKGDGPTAGHGPCAIHLARTPNVMKKYLPVAMGAELMKLADAYDEEIGLDPAPIEGARILLKSKRMFLALERMVLEAEGISTEDLKGSEKLSPLLELWLEVNKILSQWIQWAMKYELESRRVELEESQARDIVSVVLKVVLDPQLQLSQEQISLIRTNLSIAMMKISPKLRPSWAEEFDQSETIDAEEVE